MIKKQRKGQACRAMLIPKDHKGLYACEPYNHGIQQKISKEAVRNDKNNKSGVQYPRNGE